MNRLIDFLCRTHRTIVVEGRYWPNGLIIDANTCHSCTEQVPPGEHQFVTLPGIDPYLTLAIHEAGHAVVHLAQGTPIDGAEMQGNRAVVHVGGDGSQQPEGTLAGAAAVRMRAIRHGLGSEADVADAVWTAHQDFQLLYDCGFTYYDVENLLEPTGDLVAEHWAAIERVADRLLVRGRLTGDEIADLAGLEASQ